LLEHKLESFFDGRGFVFVRACSSSAEPDPSAVENRRYLIAGMFANNFVQDFLH